MKAEIGLMEGRQLVHAMASEDEEHHVFDRQLDTHSEQWWTIQSLIRVAVLFVLVVFGLALWIGSTVRALARW